MSGHGVSILRGLSSASRSAVFEGRFGFMFPGLKSASYGKTTQEETVNLMALGAAMKAGVDPAKDGADDEESNIPALYTYFGQFIDHDLTFGPEGSFQKKRDVEALVDFRSPAFDLDCVYGRGPDDQPYMYDGKTGKFLLGSPINGGDSNARDLTRNTQGRALIGDKRNDENVIVSQLQGLFQRFHNRLIDDEHMSFEEAQHAVQFHYQYMILNDFMPKIVDADVLDSYKSAKGYDKRNLYYYELRKNAFMPVEFATAAYRFGHSMIRPAYRLNDDDRTLLKIFDMTPGKLDLRGFKPMIPSWGIDWARFIDTELRPYGTGADPATAEDKKRLQFAYRIDTSLVDPLANLPVVDNPPPSLAQRNLLRSLDFSLPSGQSMAEAMGVEALEDDEILIGKATGKAGDTQPISSIAGGAFNGNCPLWTYILAEAMRYPAEVTIPVSEAGKKMASPRLGPVGGGLVTETFLGLMFADNRSLLATAPGWQPMVEGFGLREFVVYATGGKVKKVAGTGA